jgi:hypothetical protein
LLKTDNTPTPASVGVLIYLRSSACVVDEGGAPPARNLSRKPSLEFCAGYIIAPLPAAHLHSKARREYATAQRFTYVLRTHAATWGHFFRRYHFGWCFYAAHAHAFYQRFLLSIVQAYKIQLLSRKMLNIVIFCAIINVLTKYSSTTR